MNYDHILDKRRVRHAFAQAAAHYDQAAVLQHEVSDRMLSRLDYIKYMPDTILDAGSGTGYGHRKLSLRYPASQLLAADIALPMLLQARPAVARWRQWLPVRPRSSHYLCADIEQLPLKSACVDMIWSNLALQWCNDLKQTFAEMNRILRTDGLFMFSTFGPDTLKELRQAFAQADGYSHVNRFMDMHDIGDLLVHNGFATPVMDMEYMTLTYDDVMSVMRDLKAIGAHNALQGRRPGLTGKTVWRKATDQYESLRQDGRLPATFEVIYGHAWKPASRKSVLTPETRMQLGLEP
ncbi:malonyl-CoA O-methyltransferase [Nitrosomonas cryotolerans]|uniref:Malonyl-[acyl-carrier protein] O-methyltransferase n=1 Tax=Nitrosomonas cryotolerans ATCC 49181 TaxID=1131553 RepID=A0A1N6HM80_9PROT|nr:malonyl-ACP O-methyltransferase BioC [Nitrosomonas cryotolerans]SFQ05534.1 malonyl-CoA O-methyltransferase [Nitrosomonas cryotolerans]SIO20857.1 malonyl-CoA O-methyltransferase [Nitrosomonas cryotolerans ATCC 49181]